MAADRVAALLGVPAGRTLAPSLQRGLGLGRAAEAVRAACRWGRERARRVVEAVLGRSLPCRRQLARALAIERLESRVVLSVVWGANDGVFTWQDSAARTQALDVTKGDVELHFSDDVANTGDLTEIRLLSNNAGFQVTTTDIDLIRTDPAGNGSWNVGGMDIGVDVGSFTADTTGTVDRIEAAWNITKPINIYGDAGVIDVGKILNGTLFVEGDLQTLILRGGGTKSITIGGDLGSFEADFPGGPDFVGLLTAQRVIGGFTLSDGGFFYTDDFAAETQVIYDGANNRLLAPNQPPIAQDAAFHLAEDAAAGTQVGQVLVDDSDPNSLTYGIVGGNEAGIFAIDGAAGRITVADNSQLDFESDEVHSLTVRVENAGGLSDTASVTITVLNVNEPPLLPVHNFSVAEDAANGTSLGQVLAADPDAADSLTYGIVGGNEAGIFAIDGVTGRITVVDNSQLDSGSADVHLLSVRVEDAGGLSNAASVVINVLDVSDPAAPPADAVVDGSFEPETPAVGLFLAMPSPSAASELTTNVPVIAAPSGSAAELPLGPLPSGGGIESAFSSSVSANGNPATTAEFNHDGTIELPLSEAGATGAAVETSRTVRPRGDSTAAVDGVFSDSSKLAEQIEHAESQVASVTVVRTPDGGLEPAHADSAPVLRRDVAALTAAVARFAPDGPWNGDGTDDGLASIDAGRMTEALVATASALTAGFVLYGAGSSLIVTGAASRLAHWKSLDPLAVLDYFEKHPVFSE